MAAARAAPWIRLAPARYETTSLCRQAQGWAAHYRYFLNSLIASLFGASSRGNGPCAETLLLKFAFLCGEEFPYMGLTIPVVDAWPAGGYSAVPSPFSMDGMSFRLLGHRLVDTLATYLDKLPQEPVYRPLPAEVRQELEEMNIPIEGVAAEDVIESFLRLVLPY